ncbi:MAG: hypothetical protein ACJASJ_001642 [Candidatus Azotimanducaceae bacterium]
MAKRRETNIFSLSFLDIMSCGFGAVILIYITINHGTLSSGIQIDPENMAEVQKIEIEILAEQDNQVELRNSLALVEDTILTTEQSLQDKLKAIDALTKLLIAVQNERRIDSQTVEALKKELVKLQAEAEAVTQSVAAAEGNDLRSMVGEGDRQYLTGLNMGGQHILVLLDASGSMLDETLVNIIRRRNLPEAEQRASEKWQRGLRTVNWITANMPRDVQFQIIRFSTTAQSALPDSNGQWLKTSDKIALEASLAALEAVTPGDGSNLHAAFTAAAALDPQPDNIFLITDGLPTQGTTPARASLITAKDRLKLFQNAMTAVNLSIPINVILLPMEGDPIASPSFWRLAQMTGGAFLSPARDWP